MDYQAELLKINKLNDDDKRKQGIKSQGLQNQHGEFLFNFIIEKNIKSVLETGVCRGFSSCYILLALNKTGGSLTSFEPYLKPKHEIVVPEYLYDRWKIVERASPEYLLTYLESENPQLFIHDSLHTFETQFCEYIMASKHCRYVASHDIDMNLAWSEFKKFVKYKSVCDQRQFSLVEIIK